MTKGFKRKRLLSEISTPVTKKKNPVGRPPNSLNSKEKGLKAANDLLTKTFFYFMKDPVDGIVYAHCRTKKCQELVEQTRQKNRAKGRLKTTSKGHLGKS